MKQKKLVTPEPIQNPVWRGTVIFISTGLGLGFLPLAPGTWGSLLGIPLGLWFLDLPPGVVVAICFALFALFAYLAEKACRHWGEMDASRVVSDEVLGQAIAICGIKSVFHSESAPTKWIFVALAFGLFRILDIVKPFPARTFDRQATGFGVVADDVVAGVYAALICVLCSKIWLGQAI